MVEFYVSCRRARWHLVTALNVISLISAINLTVTLAKDAAIIDLTFHLESRIKQIVEFLSNERALNQSLFLLQRLCLKKLQTLQI